MKLTWGSDKGHLECCWSGIGDRAPYHPPWMLAAANVNPKTPAAACLDFQRLSPFGGLKWFDPNRGYGTPGCA